MDSVLDKLITLGGKSPRQVARTVLLLLIFGYCTGRFTRSVFRHGMKRTLFYFAFVLWKQYKGESGYQSEMSSVRKNFQHALYVEAVKNTSINKTLPTKSLSSDEILKKLKSWSNYEEELWNGKKRMSSGAVYHGGKELTELQNKAHKFE